MRYFLVDNGSLRAESILNLRRIAAELGARSGLEVIPASLLHSNRVPADVLDGVPAVNLEAQMIRFIEEGERSFTILPFFIGPTGALVDYFPMRLGKLRKRYGKIEVCRAPFIYNGMDGRSSDVARILESRVRETIESSKLHRPGVALVDHGSPIETVTAVRNELSLQLRDLLGNEVRSAAAASMERREGAAYDFNEPLLERLLRQDGWNRGNVVVSMLFLSPGRHAGPDGDVAGICREAESDSSDLKTHMTGLMGTHPDIIPLLARRLESKPDLI